MQIHELKAKTKRKRKIRVGRGNSSGHGTYSGRGIKGQKSRSGYSRKPGFEGGETSLIAQTPKLRGKGKNIRKELKRIINIRELDKSFKDKEIVNLKSLLKKGLIKSRREVVKILGEGEIKKSLKIDSISISKEAAKKIEKAGGKVIKSKFQNSKL